jgi:hypothetical protein
LAYAGWLRRAALPRKRLLRITTANLNGAYQRSIGLEFDIVLPPVNIAALASSSVPCFTAKANDISSRTAGVNLAYCVAKSGFVEFSKTQHFSTRSFGSDLRRPLERKVLDAV